MMQMIFTYRSRSTGRKADPGALKEVMTVLVLSNKGNREGNVEMLPSYILLLPTNSKMMAFLRNSSYSDTLASVKYKEITALSHTHTH